MYGNADSLSNKIPELETIVQDFNPDIIAISEVKPKSTRFPLQPKEILLCGFQEPEHNLDVTGRGVCIYVREGLSYRLKKANNFEQVVIIELEGEDKDPTTIAVMYRSPTSSPADNDKLNQEIRDIFQNQGCTIVVGDFNYSEINWASQSCRAGPLHRSTVFLRTIQDVMVHQMVVKPTHYRPGQQPTLIDLVLTNTPEAVTNITHAPSLGKSHHEMLIVDILHNSKAGPYRPLPLKYAYQRANFESIKRELNHEMLSERIKDMTCEDAWSVIKGTLLRLRESHVPSARVTIGKGIKKKPLWMNNAALTKVRKKHQAYRRYLTTKEGEDYLRYTQLRNEAQKAVRREKRQFENNIAKECKKNPKAFWGYYKDRTSKFQQIPTLIDEAGNKVECDEGKAECLNNFFASVYTAEDTSQIPTIPPRQVHTPMENIIVTKDKVLSKLNNLNITKAQGPDGIHPCMLYELRNELAEPLTILFNKSLEERTVPKDWKEAQITPIFKKGNRNAPTNYRPVSLTSVVCKVLESIIKAHMMEHLLSNDLISERQHGFVPKKGCSSNLLESVESWLNSLEQGDSVDIFFLDYSKAFDRVPHERLMSKLGSYGFTDQVQGWIRSFLAGRTQYVKLVTTSDSKPVLSGVPQGSVIGPLLFVIYVNDLPEESSYDTQMFADDTKNFGPVSSHECELSRQTELNNLQLWTNKWQMDFNLAKCNHMRLGQRPLTHQYYLSNRDGTPHFLNSVDTEKDLGVLLDRALNFEQHIDKVIKTANSVLGTIKRTYSSLTPSSFTLLYKALVRTHLEYGQEIWSPAKKRHINLLEKVQRRATKLVSCIKYLPYKERLKRLKLPSLRHRRLRGDIITMYKLTHGFIRSSLEIPYSQNLNLRGHPFKLEPTRYITSSRRHFLCNRVVYEWNRLPDYVVTAQSVDCFKARLDEHWSTAKDIYSY